MLYQFFAEAKRIWELEASQDKVVTLQAGMVLNVVYNYCGLDNIGRLYTVRSVAMAQSLGLFDPAVKIDSTDLRHVRQFTAWALFSWQR